METDEHKRLVQFEDNGIMLHIARRANALRLLPTVFYWIAANWPRDSQALSKDDILIVVQGAMKLRQALRTEVAKFLYESCPSTSVPAVEQFSFSHMLSPYSCPQTCPDAKATFLRSSEWNSWVDDSKLLEGRLFHYRDQTVPGLCAFCQNKMMSSMEEGRRNVWEKLPGYFGLPDWQTLREITSEGDYPTLLF